MEVAVACFEVSTANLITDIARKCHIDYGIWHNDNANRRYAVGICAGHDLASADALGWEVMQ